MCLNPKSGALPEGGLNIFSSKLNMNGYLSRKASPFSTRVSYLKVGSWSFEGIIILQIYFLNCRKALFTKK